MSISKKFDVELQLRVHGLWRGKWSHLPLGAAVRIKWVVHKVWSLEKKCFLITLMIKIVEHSRSIYAEIKSNVSLCKSKKIDPCTWMSHFIKFVKGYNYMYIHGYREMYVWVHASPQQLHWIFLGRYVVAI